MRNISDVIESTLMIMVKLDRAVLDTVGLHAAA
jgi:hypothetical protein